MDISINCLKKTINQKKETQKNTQKKTLKIKKDQKIAKPPLFQLMNNIKLQVMKKKCELQFFSQSYNSTINHSGNDSIHSSKSVIVRIKPLPIFYMLQDDNTFPYLIYIF